MPDGRLTIIYSIQWAAHIEFIPTKHMRVEHGRSNILMAQ